MTNEQFMNWTCPHCERHVTVTDDRFSEQLHRYNRGNADGPRVIRSAVIVCPNGACKKATVFVNLVKATQDVQGNIHPSDEVVARWVYPDSVAKTFPDYVPVQIRNDYVEACRIRDLSPKASATLSRRALQGILRDFWKAKGGNLKQEIEAIEDKVDPSIWAAIDAVRKIGNIGAHMEKDVDVIIDVEPEEAALLLQLIEQVIDESYVARHEREEKMKKVVEAAAKKAEAKKAAKTG